MEFFDVIEARRSVRKYRPEPVDRAILERIVAAGIEAPSGCNEQLRHYILVDDADTMARLRTFSRAMADAPAAIVLVVDPKATPYGEFWVQDASAAMENMLLAAVALGYAGCWVEGAIRRCEDDLRDLFGVPEGLHVWSVMPVGLPAETPARPPKSPVGEVTHVNRW